ncbi:aldo/keto reductase family protein [Kamptonema cortianum]|nr:aldo/keto reductase family protein [Geitlerinema splendidum]MDK3156361.1 aldo/keto reductase family protein [Kamptonema cortianum]
MNYRQLGKYGIKVSEVSLGGWLTHGRTLSDDLTATIVKKSFDLGINFFDTADVYNQGKAETSLGKAIRRLPRHELVIATKCFFPMSESPNDQGLSRKHIFESVHGSLKRLKVDYIDLFQFHRLDPATPLEETIRAIDDLIRQGKILYWGTSMWPTASLTEACHIAKQWRCCLPVSNQPRYNMLDRGIEKSIIPVSEKLGIGQVVFSPLAQGVLSGKYKPGKKPVEGSRASDDKSNMFMREDLSEESLRKVAQISALAKEAKLTTSQFALAWCLRKSNVSSVIVGATSVEQITENAGASGANVPQEFWDKVEALLNS